MAKKTTAKSTTTPRDKSSKNTLLSRITLTFFMRPLITGLLWLAIVVFGVLSYTTFLRREGFPSVDIPVAIISGNYFVNDPSAVDRQLAAPVSEIALQQEGISSVQTESAANFFSASVLYEEGTDSAAATEALKQAIADSGRIPENATLQYNVPYFGATGGDIEKIDVAVSFFSTTGDIPTTTLADKANEAATWLNDQHLEHVEKVFVKQPFETVTDPTTGKPATIQRSFDRYGVRQDDATNQYSSVLIGVTAKADTDVIKLDETMKNALEALNSQQQFSGFQAVESASFVPSIEDNLGELQRVLLEGLLAILIVGSLVITIRASVITVISMVTVLLTTLGFLYVIGYTLNVITLFALILGLALIVDDTIIMIEAIEAARKRQKDKREIVREATRKISRAMVAATMTAALSFAPLLFIGGILGSFIQAIPVTLISALIISLIVALIFIPFFARYILLKRPARNGIATRVMSGFETGLAHTITRPMQWARGSQVKIASVVILAVLIGTIFIGAGLAIARNVVFNIFPPTKDTNQLMVSLQFPSGTTISQADAITKTANQLLADTLGAELVQTTLNGSGTAQSASLQVTLTPYSVREPTAPQLEQKLNDSFASFTQAQTVIAPIDVGPPSQPFITEVNAGDRGKAFVLAGDISKYLETAELKRPNGTTAHFTNISVSNQGQYSRSDNQPIVTVAAGFDANDTTTLVTLAQDSIEEAFPADKVASYGLPSDAIAFNLGQESENQESFRTLALAFPILLVVMYILLAFQFRSFLQPLLIFMAIPFSIFGVMLGLDLTNNAISFFSMLGFFALVGLSIKNTILLTDYANQARRQGMDPISASREALEERFRPLFATSMTAVVSLIPLALSSPFWEGLAVVLIFGLLSSTLLVVTIFPYYYLGAELLRTHIAARRFIPWLIATIGLVVAASQLINTTAGLIVIPLSLIFIVWYQVFMRRFARPRA